MIFSILLGAFGVDRFYLGYIGKGILKLLTFGCFGVLFIMDMVHIANGTLKPADGSAYIEDSAGASSAAQSAYEQLEKLNKLHEQGVLSDGEFTSMKADLIRKM